MRKRISCIYKITNKVNGKVYIGQTINFGKRSKEHFSTLRKNVHRNQYLQQSFNKYGESAFQIDILKLSPHEKLDELEIYYMKKYDSLNKSVGYNMLTGGNERRIVPEEVRKKIGIAHKGRKNTPEHNKNIGLGRKGIVIPLEDIMKANKTKKENQIQWGESNPNAVLSNEEVRLLILEMLYGATVEDVMEKYNCSRQTVYGITRNRTYKVVLPERREELYNLNEFRQKQTRAKIVPMYLKGNSQSQIARKLKISRNTVQKVLKENEIDTQMYKNQFRS